MHRPAPPAAHSSSTTTRTGRLLPAPFRADASRSRVSGTRAVAGDFKQNPLTGRVLEVKHLEERRRYPPIGVTVLTGETRCGITTVSRHICADSSCPGIYIDLADVTSSQALLRQVLQQCGSFGSSFGVTIPGRVAPTLSHDTPVLTLPWLGGASLTFSKGQSDGPMQQARDVLNETIKAYFANNGLNAPPPVIMLDEAQALKHQLPIQDARLLLRWMAQVNKGEQRVLVYLITRDYAFVDFLEEELGIRNVKTLVLGNFSEADAQEYMRSLADQHGFTLGDGDTKEIYEVCHGNAGLMIDLAGLYKATPDLKKALSQLIQNVSQPAVQAALDPSRDRVRREYTSQQFAQVSQLVVAGDGIAAYREVIELVDPVTLKAMTRDNLLGVRPFSLLAQDIPDQRWPMRTWGDAQVPDRAVVVPAVSSHLAAMKQLGKKINTVAGGLAHVTAA